MAVCVSLVSVTTARALDRNNNQYSDVWEMVFATQNLSANGDADGDGVTNLEEARAGTNPYDAESYPWLTMQLVSGGNLQLNWPGLGGKRYVMQAAGSVDVAWSSVGTNVQSTDGFGAFPLSSTNAEMQFFRISIGDVDSDGDQILDWEELQLGFKPDSTHSERLDDTDTQRITRGMTNANTITVSALDPLMYERWPDAGVIAIRRAGGLRPLTVNIALSGTATLGADYTTTTTTNIVIPIGVREVWVEFQPVADALDAESTETITLTVQTGADYQLGAQNTASVSLFNETDASGPNPKAAARFLIQASFGPNADSADDADYISENVEEVMAMGFEGWMEDQFTRPVGLLQPFTEYALALDDFYTDTKESAWWNRVMGAKKLVPTDAQDFAPDFLRQRMGFALSQIFVISDRPEMLAVQPTGMANYYDMLLSHAFGNYRDLLFDVSMHPCMGIYLSHLLNRKPDPANNIYPDENYAREIMQLFSIGLWELNLDGSRKLDDQGQPIPTYSNANITELARVFTGLGFAENNQFALHPQNFVLPMRLWDTYHDCDPKTLLNGFTLPARTPSNPDTGTAALADINAAIDHLFNHPNVGPFVSRQLIQRFITSNPTPGYISRVASVFNNNGSGVRGDLKAVLKAILLDAEARDAAMMNEPTFGKLREPILRVVNFATALNAASTSGIYALDDFSLDHAQETLNAPSVFNFFMPGYSPPGIIADAGLVAPEFQIINAGTAIGAPNYFLGALRNGDLHRWGSGNASRTVRANLTNELSLIVPLQYHNEDVPNVAPFDLDPLLQRLDFSLTGGTLSPEQFQIIREAVTTVPTFSWMWHKERVWMTIYLIVTSPEFCVQR